VEIGVILLLVLSALVHSGWNLLTKKSIDKQVFLWLSLVASIAIFFLPFVYLYTPFAGVGWVFIVVSGLLEALYFVLLGSAYQGGDLSLVYPLARGSAPLFVALFALLALSERIVAGGIAGILLVVAGIYTLHVKSLDREGLAAPLMSLRDKTSRLALLVGLTIATYSVIDKVGVSHVNPLLYLYLVFIVAALALTPYMLLARREVVVREWRANRAGILAVAVLSIAAYGPVLFALTTSRVSYVAPVREVSVVFAALLGTFALREPFGRAKIVGSLLIFAGIVSIGLAR
jgi:uncharacterized membrane protein